MSVKPTAKDPSKKDNGTLKGPNAQSMWAFGKAVRLLHLESPSNTRGGKVMEVGETLEKMTTKYYNDIKTSLDRLSATELGLSVEQFQHAFSLFMDGKTEESKKAFGRVRQTVEHVISSSKDLHMQIEAGRIATVCALYEFESNKADAKGPVLNLIKVLNNQSEVKKMFAIRFGTSLWNRIVARFTRDKKDKAMKHLCIMNFILCDFFLGQGLLKSLEEWPVVFLSSTVQFQPTLFTLRLTDLKVGNLLIHNREDEDNCRILLLSSSNAIITYGEGRYGIESWCPKTLRQLITFADGYAHRTTIAACRGNILYIAKCESLGLGVNPTISAFNTVTNKPINVFVMVEGDCVHLLCGDLELSMYDIFVVTDDGVVHHSAEGSFDRISTAISFDIKGHFSGDNSAATSKRLIHSASGTLKVYDIARGNHLIDVSTRCWQNAIAVGNYLASFCVTDAGMVIRAEVRQVDNMNLLFSTSMNEKASFENPIISCDVADNLLLLLVEKMLTVWELETGSQLTALAFDTPGPLKGYYPSSACFYKKYYIFVSTMSGALLRFAIAD